MEAVDIQTLAGALGALLVAVYAAWQGYKKEKDHPEGDTVVGGVIQDNMSIRENTAQLIESNHYQRRLIAALEEATEQMRENKAALIRLADIELMRRS